MLGPSTTMQNLAARRLVDTVRLYTETIGVDADPVTLEPTSSETTVWQGAALVNQLQNQYLSGGARTFGLREVTVWVDTDLAAVNQRAEFVTVPGDTSLAGRLGTVIEVQRGEERAVRRCTVRLDSDT